MHSLNIVHADLKPENILLVDDTMLTLLDIDSEGGALNRVSHLTRHRVLPKIDTVMTKTMLRDVRIRIIDMEESQELSAKCTRFAGTDGYAAPEVYCGKMDLLQPTAAVLNLIE